jgi:hypothetical protein
MRRQELTSPIRLRQNISNKSIVPIPLGSPPVQRRAVTLPSDNHASLKSNRITLHALRLDAARGRML